MKAIDAVKRAAERSGVGVTEVGVAIGRDRTYISATASRGSTPKADNLAKMLGACGYRLCAVPRGDVPKSAIVIDPF